MLITTYQEMSLFHPSRAGTRGGKDQFNWDTVKSDKDRECYLGHSLMAPTGRWQEGKDLTWYAKDRQGDGQIKSAEFRAAKKVEEDALMAALGIQVMPPPPASAPVSERKPTIKREPQSVRVKNEPMTPSIHTDPRQAARHQHKQKHDARKEDRRRRRQLKATGSDGEKNDWSDDDEDDLVDDDDTDDDEDDKSKIALEPNVMTEQELDQFLIDLVKKHSLETIKETLKAKKERKERKEKRSSAAASASSESEAEPIPPKPKHKKKHASKDESRSSKRQRTRSPSPPSTKERSKHHRHR